MKRLKKNTYDYDTESLSDFAAHFVLRDPDRKLRLSVMRIMGIFVVCLMVFSVLFSVSVVLKDPPSDGVLDASETSVLHLKPDKGTWFLVHCRCWFMGLDYIFFVSFVLCKNPNVFLVLSMSVFRFCMW